MSARIPALCLFLSAVLIAVSAAGAPARAFGEISTDRAGQALQGHDTTAYFRNGQPEQGAKQFTHRWKGAVWRFASRADRDAFAADPSRYAPQYGGHCANAMSLGLVEPGKARIWKIIRGKLYVFYAERGRRRWSQPDVDDLIRRAEANWRRLRSGD